MGREAVQAWFAGRVPDGWFEGPVDVVVDREEVLVVGTLPDPDVDEGTSAAAMDEARLSRAQAFREESRRHRLRIAREAQFRFRRRVSWGVEMGGERYLFTTAAVPVMTRLRMPERAVLDTLVAAGVARSRSEALAWCVRLVGENEEAWLDQLREALGAVEAVRSQGPAARTGTE